MKKEWKQKYRDSMRCFKVRYLYPPVIQKFLSNKYPIVFCKVEKMGHPSYTNSHYIPMIFSSDEMPTGRSKFIAVVAFYDNHKKKYFPKIAPEKKCPFSVSVAGKCVILLKPTRTTHTTLY